MSQTDDIMLEGRWQQIIPSHALYNKYRKMMEERATEEKAASVKSAVQEQVSLQTPDAGTDVQERVADVRLKAELEAAKLRTEAADIRADGERNLRNKIGNRVDSLELELEKSKSELAKALEELKQLQSSAGADKVTTRE